MKQGMVIGLGAVLVGAAILVPTVLMQRNGVEVALVDTTPTASTAAAPVPAARPADMPAKLAVANPVQTLPTASPAQALPTVIDKGSAAFQTALAALRDGDNETAFTLGRALPNGVERRTLEWAAIYGDSGTIGYGDIAKFIAEAPEFAGNSLIQTRLEQSLTKAAPGTAAVLQTLGGAAPTTIDAQIVLAQAYAADGQDDAATALARQIWTQNFLTDVQEKRVLDTLGTRLDRDAHWQRAMHLMMHDRAKGSERLLPFLNDAQKTLVEARAAVSRNDADAKAKLDSVDASLHANPVYIFSRAQRARQFELWQSAVDWLDKAPAELPDAAEWWYERRALMRKLLDLGQFKLAFAVADGYRNGPEGRMVEAHFHAGWIALSFLDDAASAKAHFSAMTAHTTLPDTITQANYWLGRANTKLGDVAGAKAAYETAAKFSTVYYGQLSRTELGDANANMRPLPDAAQSTALFDANPIVQGIRLLASSGEGRRAVALLRQFGTGLKSPGELRLAAELAQDIGADHLGITIAGVADQRGAPLDLFGFPEGDVPADAKLAADRAAVFAVVRQESMFQIDAVSPAGARGLMQLMPGTAKDVARDVGVDYSPSRLVSDAGYNTLLGSTYLGTQLDRYDGSLVLAAAAYNAGPGNANKWIKAYGDPRVDEVDPVVWVERIQFQETRTYVKRVLGNYLVYREQLGKSPMTQQQALRTIQD